MKRLPLVAALALIAAACATAHAAPDFDKVTITTHPVAGNVSMLQGMGGNIGVSAGPDGILIVDDQFAPLADKIATALGALGKGAPAYVLNTHWHGDHVGGNAVFTKEAPVIAHHNVRKRMATVQKLSRGTSQPAAKEAWPEITFAHGITVHFNGEEVRVRHFPHAHTDGDSVVHFVNSKVLHTGDLVFNGLFPFVDLETGGSVSGVIAALKTLIAECPPDTLIIPGHGSLTNIEGVKKNLAMIEQTRDLVRRGLDGGKSVEDLVKAGLPEQYASFSWRFISTEKWIRTLAADLKKK